MHRKYWLFSISIVSTLALATAACGDDDSSTATTSSSSTSVTSSSGAGGMGAGGMGAGGMGQGGMGVGGVGGMGMGGMGMGGMGAGGMGGMGQGGMAETPIHGCTSASATDMTGMASVDLTWVLSFSSCIIVDVNTTVNWNGNFNSHPLVGGISPNSDSASAISMSNQAGSTASVTFSAAGTYPYFCAIHTSSMQGVVYVQ